MKKFLSILLVFSMAITMAACGTKPASSTPKQNTSGSTAAPATPDKKEKLVFWASSGMISESEQKLPQDEWVVYQVVRDFEAANPGVTVEIVFNPDTTGIHQMFKAAAMTDDGPDIVNVWTGYQLFQLKDICLDLKDLIPQKDKDELLGWETCTYNFEKDGAILAYPTTNEVCGLIYNREVLKEAGLNYDTNPAKTVEQFVADLNTLKSKGFTPLVASDGGWGEGFFVTFASWWVQAAGNERVTSNSNGVTKFSEDKDFITALETAAKLYKDGLINTDYASLPSGPELFVQGKAGFLATGNWNTSVCIEALGEENIGFMNPPDISENVKTKNTCIGGSGQALVVSKSCKNPELAVKFLSFFTEKENHIKLVKSQSKLPLRTDVTAADIGITTDNAFMQQFEMAKNYVYWADNSMNPDVNAELQKLSALAITGKMSVTEMAEALDKKAAEVS